jgi:ATP-dependent Clp protease ATP-binding subunit ClpA
MIFKGEQLHLDDLPPAFKQILLNGCYRAEALVTTGDLLHAALESNNQQLLIAVQLALPEGVLPVHLIATIGSYRSARSAPSDFDGLKSGMAPEARAALEDFDSQLAALSSPSEDQALLLFVGCLMAHLDADDRSFLKGINPDKAASRLRARAIPPAATRQELFESASGALRRDTFSDAAISILVTAGTTAGRLGFDRILPFHVFLALLSQTDGPTERLVRRQLRPELSCAIVATLLGDAFARATRNSPALPPARDCFAGECLRLLDNALQQRAVEGVQRIGPIQLLTSFLEKPSDMVVSVLEGEAIGLSLRRLLSEARQLQAEESRGGAVEPRLEPPAGLLPSEDLTWRAKSGGAREARELDGCMEAIKRALFRRTARHVLLTGLRGVGKTTAVGELARQAANGDIDFLRSKHFLLVNAADVPPELSLSKLEALAAYAGERSDLVLCVDNFDALLRSPSGGNNKQRLRGFLKEARWQLIGILSETAFEDLFASDHSLLELFTQVSLPEPEPAKAVAIVTQAAEDVAREFNVKIEPRTIERTVAISTDYILNERLPSKAIRLLRRAAEDLNYARDQEKASRDTVLLEDILRVISNLTGIPESTLAGTGEAVDYHQSLSEWVVGQDEAVNAVVSELQLIKAGLSPSGKPAAVLLFAGLTGCGKTELAKALARFYSTSKRLQTITMANYTEPHSVSGIIGVPPGYVGHELGGRLINDLNSDPYCVFLLDEADKAHPEVWKPFLNLFDEGWVVDQRGVKAFAERSIFILTSNAGHKIISSESAIGTPRDEIVFKLKKHLAGLRHPRSDQLCFPPEFLARLSRIIVFRPLDKQAMEGICRKLINQLCAFWKERREQTLILSDDIILSIANRGYDENQKADGNEGARILAKIIHSEIKEPLQTEWAARKARHHNAVRLSWADGRLQVSFSTEPPRKSEDSDRMALEQLRQIQLSPPDNAGRLESRIAGVLSGLEEDARTRAVSGPAAADAPATALATEVRALLHRLQDGRRQLEHDALDSLKNLTPPSAGASAQDHTR